MREHKNSKSKRGINNPRNTRDKNAKSSKKQSFNSFKTNQQNVQNKPSATKKKSQRVNKEKSKTQVKKVYPERAKLYPFDYVSFAYSAFKLEECPNDQLPEIVLAGRSNAGKSALVNALSGRKKLARVSQMPGKTIGVIYFDVGGLFYLVDLPGYGFTKTSQGKTGAFSSLVNDYFLSGRPMKRVLVLLDIRHEPSALDLDMVQWLNHYKVPYSVILSKADKLSRFKRLEAIDKICDYLSLNESTPVYAVSSLSSEGINELKQDLLNLIQPNQSEKTED